MHYPLPQCVYRNMKDIYHGLYYNQNKNGIMKYTKCQNTTNAKAKC